MPIKAYKNRAIRDQGVPVIARLYKGQSRAAHTGKGVPPELSHFRVEFDTEQHIFDPDRALSIWNEVYGDQPTALQNVQFLADNVDHIFSDWLEMWGRGQKGALALRRCDGETTLMKVTNDGVERNVPCDRVCECKPTGRLTFWLPEYTRASGGIMGQFMLITHGTEDLDRIRATLNLVSKSLGTLRNTAFTLYRKPTDKTTPDGMRITKHDVYLELMEGGAQALALKAADDVLALNTGTQLALPAPELWPSKDEITRLVIEAQSFTRSNLTYREAAQLAGITTPEEIGSWLRFSSYSSALNAIVNAYGGVA